MKILIIGGSGYIGVELVDYLLMINNKIDLTIVDPMYYGNVKSKTCNYINAKYQDLPEVFFKDFTDIILLGGQGSASNNKKILHVIDNNIRNFAWLLDLITPEQKFIFASSSSVYGQTDNKVVDEEFDKRSGYEPYNFYDWSKQNLDQLASLGLPNKKHFYSLRFGTVNGFSRNLRNDVMINSMVYNAKINKAIYVANNDINRPILAITDLCRAIHCIILNGTIELSGIYNLNSFNNTIGEIARGVSDICNVPLRPYENKSPIVNFKLQTRSYDFKIHSEKFISAFNFTFKETLRTITHELLNNWDKIEHFENRLDDRFENYKIIDKCIICSKKIKSLLDLGSQPLANSYTKFDNTLDYNPVHLNIEDKFPLHLHYCEYCYHVQLNCIVNPDILFKNYLYISGTSKTLLKYFDNFAINSLSRLSVKKKVIKVLDIACNDGSQLDSFTKLINDDLEIITVGVDPAENIYKDISSKKNHDIYCEFFTQSSVDKLKEKYGDFDIIIAQNVFAHISYPSEFLNLCKQLINNNGFILIQTSQKNMILEGKADTAYHEHISFFNSFSMNLLCVNNGLVLNNITENPIHGTSYIFEITNKATVDSNLSTTLYTEKTNKLYDDNTYINYKLNCIKYVNNFQNKLIEYKLNNKQIIGFGSTAKSNTILNFAKINHEYIDYIIDENPLKQNLYTPGSNILITNTQSLKQITPNTIILIIAWNFYDEIKEKINKQLREYGINFPVTILNIDTLKQRKCCITRI